MLQRLLTIQDDRRRNLKHFNEIFSQNKEFIVLNKKNYFRYYVSQFAA